jgi:hypothetical protein
MAQPQGPHLCKLDLSAPHPGKPPERQSNRADIDSNLDLAGLYYLTSQLLSH